MGGVDQFSTPDWYPRSPQPRPFGGIRWAGLVSLVGVLGSVLLAQASWTWNEKLAAGVLGIFVLLVWWHLRDSYLNQQDRRVAAKAAQEAFELVESQKEKAHDREEARKQEAHQAEEARKQEAHQAELLERAEREKAVQKAGRVLWDNKNEILNGVSAYLHNPASDAEGFERYASAVGNRLRHQSPELLGWPDSTKVTMWLFRKLSDLLRQPLTQEGARAACGLVAKAAEMENSWCEGCGKALWE